MIDGMLSTAQHQIQQAGKKLGMSESEIEELLSADARHEFKIKTKSGNSYDAYRVQHNNKLGPYKGGIRFHPDVDLNEVQALATLMSLKTAVTGLPLGGGKGGVIVDAKKLENDELEEISRGFVKGLHQYIGPDTDIPAPDVNTNAQIIDWMVDEYQNQTGEDTKASFTGKSIANGGSEGRAEATGRGGVIALDEVLKVKNLNETDITYAIQGFGNAGAFFAKVAAKDHPNWKLVAASDSSSTIINEKGLNPDDLADHKKNKGRFSDYNDDGQKGSDEIIAQEVDVLVLAAMGDAVTKENASEVKAKIIVEVANGPVNEEAYKIIEGKTEVIPAIIASSGGVIVSYLEWVQNKKEECWSEEKVNSELEKYMKETIQKTYQTAEKFDVNLSEAAYILALERLTK